MLPVVGRFARLKTRASRREHHKVQRLRISPLSETGRFFISSGVMTVLMSEVCVSTWAAFAATVTVCWTWPGCSVTEIGTVLPIPTTTCCWNSC